MLKLRIVSAILLVPLVLWALFTWPLPWFAAFIGLFILAGAWEWAALSSIRSTGARLVFVGVVGLSGIALFLYPTWIQGILAMAAAFWGLVLVELIAGRPLSSGLLQWRASRVASGMILLVSTWVAVIALRQQPQGEWLSLFLYLLVWGADTGAYFAGYRFGKHKLAPTVSPGKTWEGVAGGLFWVVVLAIASGWYVGWSSRIVAGWTVLATVTALVSVLGDLFESRIKRVAGVKDSGNLIPGHGGVMDRIDAMTAAAPIFLLVWLAWQPRFGVH